eukprot:1913679-Pyramimonas_sp.AAC.1
MHPHSLGWPEPLMDTEPHTRQAGCPTGEQPDSNRRARPAETQITQNMDISMIAPPSNMRKRRPHALGEETDSTVRSFSILIPGKLSFRFQRKLVGPTPAKTPRRVPEATPSKKEAKTPFFLSDCPNATTAEYWLRRIAKAEVAATPGCLRS